MRTFIVLLLSCVCVWGQAPPAPATQAEVDAGLLKQKFVSPFTLNGWSGAPAGGGSSTNIQALGFRATNFFLRTTNMWADGGVSSLYTNIFVANAGGVTNIMLTNILEGQFMVLEFIPATGVSALFPQFTAAQWGGAIPTMETNILNRVEIFRHSTSTNLRHFIEGYALTNGYKVAFDTNAVTRTISVRSTQVYTNYADGNISINASTDVTANFTNAVAGNRSITLSTPVIGTSGTLGLVSDGSARTLPILSPVAITWMSTNDTATATNILTTASKRSIFVWRVGMGTDGVSTNLHCWVKNQTP